MENQGLGAKCLRLRREQLWRLYNQSLLVIELRRFEFQRWIEDNLELPDPCFAEGYEAWQSYLRQLCEESIEILRNL